MSSFRRSADGIVKKGHTKGKCVSMKGDTIGGGGSVGSFKPVPTTLPRSMPLPKGQ